MKELVCRYWRVRCVLDDFCSLNNNWVRLGCHGLTHGDPS